MANLIPYDRPRGTIHSLEALEGLSTRRDRVVCLSDRTLYILQNFAALDITFVSRYAAQQTDKGYYAPQSGNPEYELYLAVVNAAQLEINDVSCDLLEGLNNIAAAVSACCGYGASGGTAPANCIQNLTNTDLLGPGTASTEEFGPGNPPDGFQTWEEYTTYKCKAAKFIWNLERQHMVALRNFDLVALSATLVTPVIAGIAGVLPAAFTPAGFVVFVSSVVAIGIVSIWSWVYMDQMIDWWDDNQEDIICALYSSGTSAAAVSALGNLLEDAIQAITVWGTLQPVADVIAEGLGVAFSQLVGNGIVEPLFKTIAAVVGYDADCSGCDQPVSVFARTAQSYPYNLLEVGDSVFGDTNDPTYGWSAFDGPPSPYVRFTPFFTTSNIRVELETYSDNSSPHANWSIYRVSDQVNITSGTSWLMSTSVWHYENQTKTVTLTSGIQYEIRLINESGKTVKFRAIKLSSPA